MERLGCWIAGTSLHIPWRESLRLISQIPKHDRTQHAHHYLCKPRPEQMDRTAIDAMAGELPTRTGESAVHHCDLAFHHLSHVSSTNLGCFACQPIPATRPLHTLRQPRRLKNSEELRSIVSRSALTLVNLPARDLPTVSMLRKANHRSQGYRPRVEIRIMTLQHIACTTVEKSCQLLIWIDQEQRCPQGRRIPY